jgi:hypothetical protein
MTREEQQLYWIYHDAKRRCINPKHPSYTNYGGRGIEFHFNSLSEWLDYMGPRPSGYEMDRIDNNSHYQIGNLRWADFSTQQKNKRTYKSNTSGIKGVNWISTTKEWVARCNNNKNGKRDYLYVGKDFFEACCRRLSWETDQSQEQIRNRRGKSFKRDQYSLAI